MKNTVPTSQRLISRRIIWVVYSFSDFFQGVPDSTFFSAVITLLVIGTIVARHLDRNSGYLERRESVYKGCRRFFRSRTCQCIGTVENVAPARF
ncbi:hypothetical protein B6J17_29965 [Klebsiella pneumoniae]|nr:hypothetical protein B6J04_29265 [Klebsiella pneumoniae]PLG89326.1 hypothetical protein B6J17_29965 [Klebsiella pneumoniae]